MRKLPMFGVCLLVALALVGCSPGINTPGHRITFDRSGMVLHATGHPDAHVAVDGGLTIAGTAIATTPAQQAQLAHYYAQARHLMDSGKTMGTQGARIALDSITTAVKSAFYGKSSQAEAQLDAQSRRIESAANAMCTGLGALNETARSLAVEIPALKPYAPHTDVRCVVATPTSATAVSAATAAASRPPAPATSGGSQP